MVMGTNFLLYETLEKWDPPLNWLLLLFYSLRCIKDYLPLELEFFELSLPIPFDLLLALLNNFNYPPGGATA